ncbi:hypothetical protein MN1_990 [Thermus phage MN1]|nr:hypothetical protein MN1_990 [Thermus phage MN1]
MSVTAIERWRGFLSAAQNTSSPPIPPAGDSIVSVGITVGGNPTLWNGPGLPPEYPQGEFTSVVSTTGVEYSVDGLVWTTYEAGQALPVSGDIRSARFFLRNGSVAIYIRFSSPPAPEVPWHGEPDVADFSWRRAVPGWWDQSGGETRAFWGALFQPLNLAEYVASRAVILVDPNTAPDLDAIQNLIAPIEGNRVRPLIAESLFRRLLARLYLALRVRGTPLLSGVLSPLFGGMDIYWHSSIANRRVVIYSGGAPLKAVKTILRRLFPAHVEIEMTAYLGFPCHTDYVWEGVCWTFSERMDVSLF